MRVSVQVTAWYADPAGGHSGYQVLASNGRLEADLLDQLADQLAGKGQQFGAGAPASAARQPFPSERAASGRAASDRSLSGQIPSGQTPPGQTPPAAPSPSEPSASEQSSFAARPVKMPDSTEPTISAPAPRLPEVGGGISSSLAQTLSEQEKAGPQAGQKKLGEDDPGLRAEAASLEEILKNQTHPKNLVAVKKSGTPGGGDREFNCQDFVPGQRTR